MSIFNGHTNKTVAYLKQKLNLYNGINDAFKAGWNWAHIQVVTSKDSLD